MTSNNYPTDKRKSEHIDIVLNQKVTGTNITTGFEAYQFRHNALPEINFDDVSLYTTFLGKPLKAPFLVSSMTGGTDQAWKINKHLAVAAEEQGWAMGLGSVRAAIEQPSTAYTFQLREYAPTIPILANLGAAQLNYGYGVNECRQVVELTQADALIFHLNSLQEVFQPEGDTRFRSLIRQIAEVCKKLDVPVGVKEVGWGIDGKVAKLLFEAGIHFIDVAGAGGTSWSQVEKYRSQHKDPLRYQAAEAFTDWGIPTAECVIDVRQRNPQGTVISSGGLYTGVEGAKAIALGADLAGYGRSLLTAATQSTPEQLRFVMQRIELECKIAMFGIGAATLSDLKRTDRIHHIHTRTTFRT
ncbi:type 2 isopentenyl-diphosphate Delta-isomerase [Kroppenstedtia pulmonis]|uniref:Isopentenyl-diphosphate delta-isomerase n=1 Tax=Kroppenstedtia pulmonis TaxID=1380685 RepID=A0A7D4C5M4_9BACL|nr:type 2 isopentenyl-diphosphate Delta-isomerase [Kroppenstedtia pulmonis]QKG83916.1 type 2 isopentenyl-diphosphate Delta-isomerase [Kroppenstedtia pulmonis]